MPKSKDQKKIEAKLRLIRGDAVEAARQLDRYRRDVRSGATMYHREDHQWQYRRLFTTVRTLRLECTRDEYEDMFKGWSLPERYEHIANWRAT